MHMKKGPVQKPGVLIHMTPEFVDGESTPQVRVLTLPQALCSKGQEGGAAGLETIELIYLHVGNRWELLGK